MGGYGIAMATASHSMEGFKFVFIRRTLVRLEGLTYT